MAAGLGFKTFTTGEVLTAADTNGYLMQGVLVFASAAARDAAITSPQEGQFAYLKDTNVTTYYTGSAWANLDTTGMTNPMTTTGDTIYSSSGSTPARLGIGSTGQVLTVAAGIPSWATPAGGGGKVLQVVSATTTTSTNIASTSLTDTTITATITPTLATSKILVIASVQSRILRNDLNAAAGLILLRGATTVADYNNGGLSWLFPDTRTSGSATQISLVVSGAVNYLDSPATTSATTYKMQARMEQTTNSGSITFQYGSAPSTITLMEIGI
tara:strand:+ start:240 stop:1055 length:816 start_codon:yes stop_codon:yes gene_type:complete